MVLILFITIIIFIKNKKHPAHKNRIQTSTHNTKKQNGPLSHTAERKSRKITKLFKNTNKNSI
jgi:hypothetical protein